MPQIAFPLSSSPGLGRQESGGRLINAYTEMLGDFARSKTVRRRAPGLTERFSVTGRSHCRGYFFSNNVLFKALDERLVKVTKSGSTYTVTDRGSLSGTGVVTFARNNKDVNPDHVVVTENGAFTFSSDDDPESYPSPNLPQPNSVDTVGSFFVFTNLFGELWASDLNSTAVNANSFTTVPAKSGTLLRGLTYSDQYFAFCLDSVCVYRNEGTSPFPLGFVTKFSPGLKGAHAVAGHQEGWSNKLIWVGNDNVVYQLDGYRPLRISTHDVERAVEDITDGSTIEACVYMSAGHAIFSLSSPTWTWEYNLTTGLWHERKSYGGDRWRGSRTIPAFNQWLVGDLESGKTFAISEDAFDEGGDPLIFHVESGPGSAFPGRIAVPRVDFDFEVGVGQLSGVQPTETDPVVLISWSDDGGATWCNPIPRSLGQLAKFNTAITVNRTGMAGPKGRMWRAQVSDPVRVALYGGTYVAEGLAA